MEIIVQKLNHFHWGVDINYLREVVNWGVSFPASHKTWHPHIPFLYILDLAVDFINMF